MVLSTFFHQLFRKNYADVSVDSQGGASLLEGIAVGCTLMLWTSGGVEDVLLGKLLQVVLHDMLALVTCTIKLMSKSRRECNVYWR